MYPKNFFATVTTKPKAGTCYVVMPFAQVFDPIFRLIKSTLERELHLKCTRADDVLGGGNIMEDVLRGMAESDLIVVDVTDRNPNVFYELGIAHMCKPVEKVLLLSQQIESIPFDLRPFRHIIYKDAEEGLAALRTALKDAVEAVQTDTHRILLTPTATGTLDQMIMGEDHALYEFEALGGAVGDKFVKCGLRVTRHAMERNETTMSQKVVFNGGFGLNMGEVRIIPGTEWTLEFERIGKNQPCLRIDKADNM